MKKQIALILILAIFLSLAGCADFGVKTYLVEEEGRQYLILPESKRKLSIAPSDEPYLDSIDPELLRSAEKKILDQLFRYEEESYFNLACRDGQLGIHVEVIVELTPPSTEEGGGCGIDHEHIFFFEPITKTETDPS